MNLTEHEIVLESQIPSGAGDQWGSPQPSTVCLRPEGRLARVDDDGPRLGEAWLNAGSDLVRLTRMRRSRQVTGLPAARPGTRYVVPRLTALAARHRGDLVFPFREVRDTSGRVVRTRGLASFRRGRAVADRYRDWRAAARDRRSRSPLNKLWLTGVLFASATALLSGALGLLPGVVDGWDQHGWAGGGQVWTSWLTGVFGGVGLVVLVWAAWRWRRRGLILDGRGTAYVIEEQAITWRHEEKASVLAIIGKEFASMLRVPGPEALGGSWRWQAGADGAPQWDARTEELVRSFWAVHYNDDQVTRNAVFTWAPWPVAMAFGARATAHRRGLVLHVRQRPSYGAGGPRQQLRLTDGTHDFLRDERLPALAAVAPEHTLVLAQESLTVTIQTLNMPNAEQPHEQERPLPGNARGRATTRGAPPHVLLLVVRLVDGPIGPIPVDLAQAPEITLSVSPELAGSVIPAGTHTIPVAEWRLTPNDEVASHAPQVPWPAFPAAAERIADWVAGQSEAHPGHVVLLATRIPQELAVDLGIQLAQRAQSWPSRVCPVYYADRRLVVPVLRLGAESVPGEQA